MSSRPSQNNTASSRFPRDRTPPRSFDSRSSGPHGNAPPASRIGDSSSRLNDPYGYSNRGREPPREPREPPRGPKALVDPPRGGAFIPRGRGGVSGRADIRERDFRDPRDEPFLRRGRGQEIVPRERFDRRPSPTGRDRSRSPFSRDSRNTRDARDYPSREELRKESREPLSPVDSDNFPRGRGGFRGRGRGRGDWDYIRDKGQYPEERDPFGPRSRSRERGWDRSIRDDRDHDRDFEPSRRDDDLRREREDRERDDRSRREPPPFRPDSRNSAGGGPTPLTSRSTSATSVHLANLDRFTQNARESRDGHQDPRPRHAGSSTETKIWGPERHFDRSDQPSRRSEAERFEARMASPPPQAPPVPAFGSILRRTQPSNQDTSSSKQPSPSARSPLVHPSRLGLVESTKDTPSAPKALTISNAPTAPKAQQPYERRIPSGSADSGKGLPENDSSKSTGVQRAVTGPQPFSSKEAAFDQVRNISKRFSNTELEKSPTRPSTAIGQSSSDPTQSSMKKGTDEQGQNAGTPIGGSTSMLVPPAGDTANKASPIKIPTGPRADRGPPPVRQPPPPSIRGPASRGPSMMQRPSRGGAWSWVNPHSSLPRNTPRGPSIMNSIPAKRDSVGEDKGKAGLSNKEFPEATVAKWRRDNAPPSMLASKNFAKDVAPSQPSPGIMHRAPANNAVKLERAESEETSDQKMILDENKGTDESDEADAEDIGLFDEEDFKLAEAKHKSELNVLEMTKPPSPRSNPQLLGLLEELDALASALEEKTMAVPGEKEAHPAAQIASGLPSPKVGDVEEMDYKFEPPESPFTVREKPQTPSLDSLPFLPSGPPTPFSEIEDLKLDSGQQDTVMALLMRNLMQERDISETENDETRRKFAESYLPWRMSVEEVEDTKKADETMAESPDVENAPIAMPTPSVLGRRGRVISEQGLNEVLQISLESAAQEEQARRERGAVYAPIDTFDPQREAEVPEMLNRFDLQVCNYVDTNNLVDPDFVLEDLCFTPKQDDFTDTEKETFLYNYLLHPKKFGVIADQLEGRDYKDCVQHYYSTKLSTKYKDQEAAFLKTKKGRKMASQSRNQVRPRQNASLIASFDGLSDFDPQSIALTEKGRPRRAAAPTFGDTVETECATRAITPARRGAAITKDGSAVPTSSEKPTTRRARAPTKEKPGRKPKTQLLAAAPGPSPQKGIADASNGTGKEPFTELEPRKDDLENAQLLAGLSKGHNMQIYQQAPVEWPPTQRRSTSLDRIPQHVPQVGENVPPPIQQKAASSTQTSSYWSVPEQQDFYNLVKYFGTDWQAIAAAMKTKTHIMVMLISRHFKTNC